MSRSCRSSSGFTLVELMIVVAIIGVLAAIAVPNFLRYQLRARSAEALTHVKGIALCEDAYYTEEGTFVHMAAPVPVAVPGSSRTPWPMGTDFDTIGWSPDGSVIFQYVVSADATGTPGALNRFTAEATGDLDSDTSQSFFAYYKPAEGFGALAGSLPGTTCDGTGTYGSGSPGGGAFNVAGACDPDSGRDRF